MATGRRGAWVLALGTVLASPAWAVDVGIAARKLVVLDKLDLTGRARTRFVARDGAITKGSATDPAAISARFDVRWEGERGAFVVPPRGPTCDANGWRLNQPDRAKFAAAGTSPTGVSLLVAHTGTRLRLVSRGLGDDPIDVRAGGPPGSVYTALSLTNGGETIRHCSEFPPGSCAHRLLAGGEAARLVCRNGRPDPDCTAAPKRVLVVGLDGGDWRYLQPLIDGGFVPGFEAFQHAAAWGGLDCVPANPALACFCPIVWTSLVTGWSSAGHGITSVAHGPADRLEPAIWNLLPRFSPTAAEVALASVRGTWPPEDDTTWNVTEPGAHVLGARHFFEMCPSGEQVAAENWPGSLDQPGTWTQPSDLLERLGLIPVAEPRVIAWTPLAADRTSQDALVALLASQSEAPRLAMTILHHIDKTNHLDCAEVTSGPFGAVDGAALQAQAASYAGPVTGCPWGWGNTASSYMEADGQFTALQATQTWDYVLIVSDHGMTQVTTDPVLLACHHTAPPAFDGSTFGIRGSGVRPGPVGVQSVLCVAPLLAYLLDAPVSAELPCVASGAFGAMLDELFTPEHLAAHPPTFIPSW